MADSKSSVGKPVTDYTHLADGKLGSIGGRKDMPPFDPSKAARAIQKLLRDEKGQGS